MGEGIQGYSTERDLLVALHTKFDYMTNTINALADKVEVHDGWIRALQEERSRTKGFFAGVNWIVAAVLSLPAGILIALATHLRA